MSISDTYSKRNKPPSDIFAYDLNDKIKVQIIYIWTKYFEQLPEDFRMEAWKILHSRISVELGKKSLLENDGRRFYDHYKIESYFEKKATLEECLDIIEFVFKFIVQAPVAYSSMHYGYGNLNLAYGPVNAISDLNKRFLEHNFGYELQQGKIIKINNTLLHKEVIIPTFDFITSKTFQNVNEEFLSAHDHYRKQNYKECLNDCLKAFESTMKIICTENNWMYKQNDTSQALIVICLTNNLIPASLQTQFSSLRSLLESGIPTLRNKKSGHGQGPSKIVVPPHLASYMLFMTGTTIQFLISCQKEIKPFQ